MEGGPSGFIPGFTCPVLLWCHLCLSRFRLREFHPLRSAVPKPFDYPFRIISDDPQPRQQVIGLASFPFARRYLGNRCFFLLLGLLRCFSSPRFLILRYFIHTAVPAHYYRWVPPFGNLRFITDICSLPQLIAACHVLHRLLVPRHPPYALFNLTVNSSKIIVKTLSENFFSGFSV